MMEYHKVCKDCVLNNDCLLQDNNHVEDCEDVMEDMDFEEYDEQ